MPPHPYTSMTPHQTCLCPYFTYTPMYAPYLVPRHPNITSLVYLHRPPSRRLYSMLKDLLTREVLPNSSKSIIEKRMIRRNQRSNVMNHRRRYSIGIKDGGGVIVLVSIGESREYQGQQ